MKVSSALPNDSYLKTVKLLWHNFYASDGEI